MDPAPLPPTKQPLSDFTPQSDPSKYIRTYAKDVALLTNQPPPESPLSSQQEQGPEENASAPVADDAAGTGVSLPAFDSSPVNHPNDPASPKEFPGEDLHLSAADSEGIFTAPGVSTETAPLMPSAIPETPTKPAPPVPQPEAETERESILTRLREKVAQRRKEAEELPKEQPASPPAQAGPMLEPIAIPATPEPLAQVPMPQPVAEPEPSAPAEPLPLRTAAPTFMQEAEIVPPLPQVAKKPEMLPVNELHAEPEGPSPLHTYSSDFAEHIDEKDSSAFSVLAAQSDAGQTPKPRPKRRKSIVPLIAGACMVFIGIGAVFAAYLYVNRQPAVPMVQNIPSNIRFDESVQVQGRGEALMDAIAAVASGAHVSGNVVVTYVTNASSTDAAAGGIPQPGGTLIGQLALPAPSILLRNIEDSSTVGVISAGSESRPFLILNVSSYERTFAGMLAWEKTMPDDLATFYPPYDSAPSTTASTTASTTLASSAPAGFSDDVVDNHDVRVLRDSYGRSLMLYGYDGKDTLVIARDEAAFTALLSRLGASGQ